MPESRITARPTLAPDAGSAPTSPSGYPSSVPTGDDIPAILAWCVEVGRTAPRVGDGSIAAVWELLAGAAHRNVATARVLEPHLDALGILAQTGTDLNSERDPWALRSLGVDDRSSWGVFAAEGPGMRVEAREDASGWTLDGTKPWCSLAADVSHALVTAFVGDERRLFAVSLAAEGVSPHHGPWVARGLPGIVSAPVDFTRAAAVPVGDVGWYLRRPGFAWGGMSVAACWWGGAVGLRDALAEAAAAEHADQVAFVHLGRVDTALWAARAVLSEAADLVDRRADVDMRLLAERVRTITVDAATLTLAEADAALGPRPLVADEQYARRVADLHLYLRQHHGLRDAARLGRLVLESEDAQ
ncbi:acyl-CoA dehydrogenase [Microbacterium sulfonylureivorans]|uniref:acyl-CoA dehydrogenase n=1 Tax=Microbacterium sulfonylureivorans TaxID=2486854 RepID=UPI001F0CC771|nr:acyl-CoA dehydrogenase [Microbacterium sulfonylureivorans]